MKPLEIKKLMQVALTAHQQGDLEEAINHYQQVLTLKFNHVPALINLAGLFKKQGHLVQANEYYIKALSLEKKSPELWFNYGNLLAQQGRQDAAKRAFRSALDIRPDMSQANINLGNLLRNQGHRQEALECYDRVSADSHIYPTARANAARLLGDMDRTDEALIAFRVALNIQVGPSNQAWVTDLAKTAGRVALKSKRFIDARDFYSLAIAQCPDDPELHNAYAVALAENQEFGEAIAQWQRVLVLNPDHANAHLNLGTQYRLLRQFARAEKHLVRAVELGSEGSFARASLASVLLLSGNIVEAEKHLKVAIKMADDPRSRALLAGFEELVSHAGKAPPPPTATERATVPPVASLELLIMPRTDEPLVSIVIPVFNQWHHTYACLRSIIEHTGGNSYEVIVVNDASNDMTAEILKLVSNLRVIANEKNAGFIASCNRGAEVARGRYLVFLNNDTEVMATWLQAMLSTFEYFPTAGLVGAKLIFPGGSLQEAGGIVFANAKAWHYGRGDDPRLPRYNFARPVDYCSGACLLIETALFQELQGFDSHYSPAYYEDTDLAFRVRALGRSVIYQPRAEVIHFEGATSGTDPTAGVKRYQAINLEKFEQRWRPVLAEQPLALEQRNPIPDPAGFDIESVANYQQHRGHVLIIDATTPMPDQDSGSLRMFNLMQVIRELGYRVSFLPQNLAWIKDYTSQLQAAGVEVLTAPWVTSAASYLEKHGHRFSTVILSRYYVAARFIDDVRRYAPKARIMLDTVDLHYLRQRRLAALKGDPVLIDRARDTQRAELEVARKCDLTLVVSPTEKIILAEEAADIKAHVVSNIHTVYGLKKSFNQRNDLLFIGGFQHPPNADGILWFVREIFPIVHKALPSIRLHIVGSKANAEILALNGDSVIVHGHVKNADPFFSNCRLAVAPLRYGAGVKGKVNMSMSFGQPVVATGVAVEGMNIRSGIAAMVADDRKAFGEAVIEVYQNETLWNKLSKGGLANVEQHFSFAAGQKALQALGQL